jgi:hypothetical protein
VYTRAWPQRRQELFFQGSRLDVKTVPPGGITINDEDIVIDANILASHLGLSEQKLKAEMRSGLGLRCRGERSWRGRRTDAADIPLSSAVVDRCRRVGWLSGYALPGRDEEKPEESRSLGPSADSPDARG